MAIESSMLRAQHAEKNFVLSRDDIFAREVHQSLEQALAAAARMQAVEDAPVSERMSELINGYGRRFQDVVEAWRLKGLDHNSGLQGAFRDSVHELEDMAGQLKVDQLYLLLLQIRRGEKDLGLRREAQYQERVTGADSGVFGRGRGIGAGRRPESKAVSRDRGLPGHLRTIRRNRARLIRNRIREKGLSGRQPTA